MRGKDSRWLRDSMAASRLAAVGVESASIPSSSSDEGDSALVVRNSIVDRIVAPSGDQGASWRDGWWRDFFAVLILFFIA